jgi:hypothetical protein
LPEIVQKIRDALNAQEASIGSPNEFMERDGLFHIAIAQEAPQPS